jgi:hypothetical protein
MRQEPRRALVRSSDSSGSGSGGGGSGDGARAADKVDGSVISCHIRSGTGQMALR